MKNRQHNMKIKNKNKEINEFKINFLVHTYLSGKRESRIFRFPEKKSSFFGNTF